MEKKVQYIRCPRCELNFIQKKDKYCSVCKAEMSAEKDDFVDDLDMELCPICKTNYIQSDEMMCANCFKERGNSDDDFNDNNEWNSYINQEEDDFILPNEDTGELNIVDMDDEGLDEDIDLDDEEFGDENLDEDDDDFDVDLDEDVLDENDDDFDDDDEF